MRANSLYIKIFLSFIALLVAAEILILIMFRISVMENEPWRAIRKLNRANAFIIQELIRSRITAGNTGDVRANRPLKELLERAGFLYKARIWLEFPARGTAVASFSGPLPAPRWMKQEIKGNNWAVSMVRHEPPPKHFRFPITLASGEPVIFNAIVDRPPQFINEGIFLLGLAVIGVAIALVTIPVSRFFSVPIKKLSRASRSIAEGNLSERVTIDRNDEIGDLGRAFNNMAQRVEDMIRSTRELSAHLSHELRSPLTRMGVTLELLSRNEENGGASDKRLIQSLGGEIMEMDRLIGDILRLSRLDLREKNGKEETLDVSALIRSVVKKYEAVIGRKSLTLRDEGAGSGLTVKGNGDDLRTAVVNIIDNAVKHTPENGTISIAVNATNGRIHIVVENSSSPIKESDIARLFEPFFRPDTTAEHGYGLGLAITRKIIEMHGGTIRAGQREGKFTMETELPAAE